MITKICPQCKMEFHADSNRRKYCSKQCASKSMMARKSLICPVCGKSVVVRNSQKYCSKTCMNIARRGVKLHPPIIKICPVCNNQFEAPRKCYVFCSRKCADVGKHKAHVQNISADERLRRSELLKSRWNDSAFREAVVSRMRNNNPVFMPGIIDKARKTRLQNGSYNNNFKYGNGQISEYEQKVYAQLIFAGFYYNYAIPTKLAKDAFPDRKYPNSYKPDFVNLKTKLCIEIDGNNHRLPSIKVKDKKKEECLQFLGFSTIRFTHKDIDEGKFDLWLNSYQKDI